VNTVVRHWHHGHSDAAKLPITNSERDKTAADTPMATAVAAHRSVQRRCCCCCVGWIAILAFLWPIANAWSNGNRNCRFGCRSRLQIPARHQWCVAAAALTKNSESETTAVDIPSPSDVGSAEEQSPLGQLLRSLACGERSLVHLPAAVAPPSWNIASGTVRTAAGNEWDCDDVLFPEPMIRQCHCDALALKAAGFGARAGVLRDTSVTEGAATAAAASVVRPIRSRVHQIWLQTPTNSDSHSQILQQRPLDLGTMVGYMDARRALLQWLERLRRSLNEARRCKSDSSDDVENDWLPHHLVEASYVVYDANGAYYDKHFDVPTTKMQSDSKRRERRRAISVILYLGLYRPDQFDHDSTVDEPPWSVADGGELRIHGAQHVRWLPDCDQDATSSNGTLRGHEMSDEDLVVQDLAPRPGTLVLFDSASVPHEVRSTLQRGRVAVVAWFGTLS
jgi:2OG-Fe(II) oxygenase superfamily